MKELEVEEPQSCHTVVASMLVWLRQTLAIMR